MSELEPPPDPREDRGRGWRDRAREEGHGGPRQGLCDEVSQAGLAGVAGTQRRTARELEGSVWSETWDMAGSEEASICSVGCSGEP